MITTNHLEVELIEEGAKAPTVAHPYEDLGYDLYALEDVVLLPGRVSTVRTGIAVRAFCEHRVDDAEGVPCYSEEPMGLLIEDRSGMAAKGITKSAGVIDAGYRGEIKVLLTLEAKARWFHYDGVDFTTFNVRKNETIIMPFHQKGYKIAAGDKFAQMRPTPVLTGKIQVVKKLTPAERGGQGFGSSGAR